MAHHNNTAGLDRTSNNRCIISNSLMVDRRLGDTMTIEGVAAEAWELGEGYVLVY